MKKFNDQRWYTTEEATSVINGQALGPWHASSTKLNIKPGSVKNIAIKLNNELDTTNFYPNQKAQTNTFKIPGKKGRPNLMMNEVMVEMLLQHFAPHVMRQLSPTIENEVTRISRTKPDISEYLSSMFPTADEGTIEAVTEWVYRNNLEAVHTIKTIDTKQKEYALQKSNETTYYKRLMLEAKRALICINNQTLDPQDKAVENLIYRLID